MVQVICGSQDLEGEKCYDVYVGSDIKISRCRAFHVLKDMCFLFVNPVLEQEDFPLMLSTFVTIGASIGGYLDTLKLFLCSFVAIKLWYRMHPCGMI
ncbi:hypothetical protein GOP47_0008466 [Adiantum capillus-veneris]|uniref:Uncharacterized protein n=1 Tax=Adiantum capillus-veneris TaxID=13818 RepID=A0A9D4UYV9_ADICA|nr:hypothetical protein GOP47_0008466 [Adiantum capillus-veneris]